MRGARIVGVVGLVLHFAVGVFPYSASGLLAPLYGLILLYALWALLLIVAIRLYRTRPWWTPAAPIAAVAIWFLVLTLGERLLGWTA